MRAPFPAIKSGRTPLHLQHAEITLRLPGRPPVRRELLQFDGAPRVFTLRPDGTHAHATLEMGEGWMLASLAGPEQADLEVEWICGGVERLELPLWAVATGNQAEVSLWDAFGRLAVSDVLARSPDAPAIELLGGRYVLTASVLGETSLIVGAGISVASVQARRLRDAAG